MTPRSLRRSLLLVCCLGLVLTAGCVADGGADVPDGDTVAENLRSIDAVEATAVLEVDVGNETTVMEMDLLQRVGTGEFRASVVQRDAGQRFLMVSNGTETWMYNRSDESAMQLEFGGLGESNWNRSVESVSGMFESLASSADDEDVSISPLPVVPGGDGGAGVGSAGLASMPTLGNVTVTYDGTATAAGRQSHVIDVEPAAADSIFRNGTLWFDAERYYPLKAEYEMSVAGQSAEVSVSYRNLTYDPSIPSGAFEFDPPEDVTVDNMTDSIETFQSREELAAAAETSVPDPEIPESYAFSQGSITGNDSEQVVSLQYANATGSLVVNERPAGEGNLSGEPIAVADREGHLVEFGDARSIVWECGDSRYTVSGSLSVDRLQAVAESMVCG